MTDAEKQLYDRARGVSKGPMSNTERAEQRESFAYGNTKIENDRITKKIVKSEAAKTDRRR